MRVPQVNERVKEAPAHALRAMFAGIGQLLSVSDKIRNKSASDSAPADAETSAPGTVAPETAAAETAAPETAAAETVTPETVASETGAAEAAAPAAAAAPASELPLANYDELSIASLRARLRNLSADQLNQLIDYEKANAARPDVITMFERRIAKLAEG